MTAKNYLFILLRFLHMQLSLCDKRSQHPLITARLYAGAVCVAALCLSVCLSVCHKSEFYVFFYIINFMFSFTFHSMLHVRLSYVY